MVKPGGIKLWRYDYTRPSGKRNTLSFGKYPAASLDEAQTKLREAQGQLAKSIDPAEACRASHENSLETVAHEWLKLRTTWSDGNMKK